MTGKNRRHYHCKALNSLLCADVPLRNYSLTPMKHVTDTYQ